MRYSDEELHLVRRIRDGRSGWGVRKAGEDRCIRVFPFWRQALNFGRVLARGFGCQLYIHRRDGIVGRKENYKDVS
jgi:hypothetical protein